MIVLYSGKKVCFKAKLEESLRSRHQYNPGATADLPHAGWGGDGGGEGGHGGRYTNN